MKIYEEKNQIILENINDFEPKHIFECGQCFRWDLQENGSYTGIAKGKVINVKKEANKIYIDNTNMDDFNNIWYEYFDLGRDYTKIKNELKIMDKYLNQATEFGYGIRILKQDEWEMIISFIISANNRIPMIKKVINNLSQKFGTYVGEYKGEKYYSFPTPQQLSKATVEEIRSCQSGFRDKYIKGATEFVIDNEENVHNYTKLSTNDCKQKLLQLNGVGPKVSDCIALFGMQKFDTFPVDVWVKRVMQEFYVDENMSLEKIRKYALEKFSDLSGFAQQYLFYYARELGIGK